MVKKIISVATAFLMLCCMIPFAAFAEDILEDCPKCGEHTYTKLQDFSMSTSDFSFPIAIKKRYCSSCNYTYYEWNCLGITGYKEFDDGGYSVIVDYLNQWANRTFGQNATAQKIDTTNGGGNIPAAGGRNPKGYGSEGKANVTSSGVEVLWVEPLGISSSDVSGFKSYAPSSLIAGASGSGDKYFSSYYLTAVYYFTAPVSGLYYIGSSGSPYDCGTFNSFWNNSWVRKDLVFTYDEPYQKSMSLAEGKSIYLYFYTSSTYVPGLPYKYYLNNVPIFVEPLADSSITTTNNLTINNNTWTGNIYTDSSTNLTYIYPQYTTINESGDTITNISENPIIYNSETKQYYTYDSVTNNYYYITYEQQPSTPTPSPSPSPSPAPSESPTPDPGENPTPTSTPGGGTIITPGGDNPSSTSTPESGNKGDGGSSGWNPLKWLTDLLKDLIESILKGIWKLLTSIFGFILWLLSLLFKLFPWIPNSGILALCAGVVVVTVIRIIKFITGR